MKYCLGVVTHGDAHELGDTLASFDDMVVPKPSSQILVHDGQTDLGRARLQRLGTRFSAIDFLVPQRGFCYAVNSLWTLSRLEDVDYVFWLEHDFLFKRRIDLNQVHRTLEANKDIGQMSFLRPPELHEEPTLVGDDWERWSSGRREWMTQRAYWTTNPSLIPVPFMHRHQWPMGPHCEGKFTHQLLQEMPEILFGVWGSGDPWVEHVGVRSGKGY